jgi:Spy/CpxP family protein refolding chaperone
MEEKSEGTGAAKPNRRRAILWASLVGGSALLTLVAARPITAAIQNTAGGFHHSWRGHWGGGGEAMSPEAAKEHLQIASKWMLRDIDASPEQQDRVNAIVAGAVDDLFRLRDRHQQNRDAFHAQFGGGATVDRAALEEIRKSEMGLADEASKRLVQALADVSDVLTPEQRQALAERIHRHHAN